MGVKSNQILVIYSRKLCSPIALAYLSGSTAILDIEWFMVGLVFMLLLVAYRVLSGTKNTSL